ncbi:hypothetical protein GCM10023321_25870 [Pseudonocardia eucalypti]|uniref:Uncharacterized protein n=1 Tax=Pseudonocardia eucalypti TaxID=648755 RepID=A0ABP9PYR7_9PSEU|nr:hypothetical protein [Pseudonocardia eucalypti]
MFLFIAAAAVVELYFDPANTTLPWHDPHAVYRIEKDGDSNYLLAYTAHWLGMERAGTLLIGQSTVELAPYVGKPIRFQGSVNYNATQQCIRNRCHKLFGPSEKGAAINIERVSAP